MALLQAKTSDSEDVLEMLSCWSDRDIRREVARNLSLPRRLWPTLAHDSDNEVRKSIALRDDLSASLINVHT